MKVAVTLLEEKRKKTSLTVMFQLDLEGEKMGKPQIIAMARKLSRKKIGQGFWQQVLGKALEIKILNYDILLITMNKNKAGT